MRNKPRLCLALYARPKHPGTYHYALLVCPKKLGLAADKYHVKNNAGLISHQSQPWSYETGNVQDLSQEYLLLARFVIAKVTKPEKIDAVLRRVPLYHEEKDVADVFTCLTWVHLAAAKLRDAGVVSRLQPWHSIRGRAVRYVEQKKLAGRWDADSSGRPLRPSVPTVDLLRGPLQGPNPEVMP